MVRVCKRKRKGGIARNNARSRRKEKSKEEGVG
jgi:hypothetical protein